MNSNMQQQILNLKLFIKNAKTQFHYAALEDDGTVDRDEQKNLKILDTAIEKFLHSLDKIK